MNALVKLQSAGFEVRLKNNGNILVSPFSKLTQEQREFIRSHKPEIIRELKAANDSETKFKRFVVTCNGNVNIVNVCGGIALSEMRSKFAKSEVEILH